MQIEYDYSHVPTIGRFASDDSFIRGLMGPVGSGKSSGCVMEIFRRGLMQAPSADGIRPTRWAVVRNSYPQLRDTTERTFLKWFPPAHFGKWTPSSHNYRMLVPLEDGTKADIEILFMALDRPDQVGNLLSLELTGAWFNEAREIPHSIVMDMTSRLGRYPSKDVVAPTWKGLFMDTNPPDTDSWWYKLFEEDRLSNPDLDGKIGYYTQPSGISDEAENKMNLVDGYYEDMIIGKSPEWVNVYVHGKYGYIQDGAPVYSEYDDSIHTAVIEPIKSAPMHRGWDFGLQPCVAFSQVLPDGRWLVFDEMVSESMGVDRFSDDVLTYCGQKYKEFKFEDEGDPAGIQRAQTDESTCFDILRSKGIMVVGGIQDVRMRLESVRKPLNSLRDGKPMFILHPRCKVLRSGFMGKYKYRKVLGREGIYSENPDKNAYSHVHDALQYTATVLFASSITNRNNASKKIVYKHLKGIV